MVAYLSSTANGNVSRSSKQMSACEKRSWARASGIIRVCSSSVPKLCSPRILVGAVDEASAAFSQEA